MAKEKGKVCGVDGCKNTCPPDRPKYCSAACAHKAQQQQLREHSLKRKAKRAEVGKIKCSIPGCGNEFARLSSSHKYCSDACALLGLQTAIERQRERRAREKEAKRKASQMG